MHYGHVSESVIVSLLAMLAGLVVLYLGFAIYLRKKYGPTPKKRQLERTKRQPTSKRKR
ncbi:hypothetical protein LMG23994_00925 [Cupriavidus pinatubonensis]|uniref:Uncharacterized protein n=1 Tax=Cupriavidus pinatubonensis TaxID=248026 RepID=A0ABM8WFS3_9BURK|nr:hypothetical protein LMG23994_00925 [Cupriavidus pinatubonensis]